MSTEPEEPKRDLLIEVSGITEECWIHASVRQHCLYGKASVWGESMTIVGTAHERDADGFWTARKAALIKIELRHPIDVEEGDIETDAEKRPVLGLLNDGDANRLELSLIVPNRFAHCLVGQVRRSLATPGTSRSIGITLYRCNEAKPMRWSGEYATALYFSHPSDLEKGC